MHLHRKIHHKLFRVFQGVKYYPKLTENVLECIIPSYSAEMSSRGSHVAMWQEAHDITLRGVECPRLEFHTVDPLSHQLPSIRRPPLLAIPHQVFNTTHPVWPCLLSCVARIDKVKRPFAPELFPTFSFLRPGLLQPLQFRM